MAKITDLPATQALTGAEHLPVVQGGATKRVTMAAFRDLITPFLQQYYKGDRGDPGAANSTYVTKAELLAAKVTSRSYIFAPETGEDAGLAEGVYLYRGGDFSGAAFAAERLAGTVLKLNTVSLETGALVRQSAASLSFQHGAGLPVRDLQAKVRDTLSVKDWGAKGDNFTDDTDAIIAANAVATTFGKTLLFPTGRYRTRALNGTTDWTFERGAILKGIDGPSGYAPLVTFDGVEDLVLRGVAVDGNVSADPANWSTGYNSFTGYAGIRVMNCDGPQLIQCRAQNVSWSGISIVRCSNVAVSGCTARRMRGNFGDGILVISSVGISISDFFVTDYTRIGVVTDSYGPHDAIIPCQKVVLTRIIATNGHHASAIFGGAEFNSGIWCENSADIAVSDSFTADNTHRGICVCTGPKPADFPGTHALVTITNCHTIGGIWGIVTYSLNDLPILSKVINCSAKRAIFAFEGDARNGNDSFAWINSHADYDASSAVGRGYATEVLTATGKPSFIIGAGCTVSRWRETSALLLAEDASASTADVGSGVSPAGALNLSIDGLRHIDGKPIVAKWFGNYAHNVAIDRVDLRVPHGGSYGGLLSITGCDIRDLVLAYGSAFSSKIENNNVFGRVWADAVRGSFSGNTIAMFDNAEIWLDSEVPSSGPAWLIGNNRFEKNINLGPVLRLGFGSDAWQAILTSNIFHNSGGAEAAKPFVRYAASVRRAWAGNFVDDSVTNITMLDSGGGLEPAVQGVTRITMH